MIYCVLPRYGYDECQADLEALDRSCGSTPPALDPIGGGGGGGGGGVAWLPWRPPPLGAPRLFFYRQLLARR